MSKSKPKELKRYGMSSMAKIMFTGLFFLMGFSIMGAAIRGAPATAPVVLMIGLLMNTIGVAPYIIPLFYKYYVDPKKTLSEVAAK